MSISIADATIRTDAHTSQNEGRSLRPLSQATVLVAEDHGFQRRLLVRMLSSLGANTVLEASTGKDALEAIGRDKTIDLIVSDLDMEEMDGMELIRHASQIGYSGNIIITSSHERELLDSVGKMARAYGVALLGILKKPVTLECLENLMAAAQTAAAQRPERIFGIDEISDGISAGEFHPYFQPKIDLASGRVVGAEALARWRHPEFGMIGPNAFIPPLERAGQLESLTFQMIAQASTAGRRWRDAGAHVTVSVNLSPSLLDNPGLAARVAGIVSSAGLKPQDIVLEITETAAARNLGSTLENLVRLRMRGFGLSIDDYGTGFSTLQQLQLVPFTELKIDKCFVAGCDASNSFRSIIGSSVQLAHGLGAIAVAEGIETRSEWEVLKQSGCDAAQGYLISRPLSEADFVEFIQSNPVI
jgi:EAL domain-containing protein (putative c-di-GMP-specific phosphodiesterase class I)